MIKNGGREGIFLFEDLSIVHMIHKTSLVPLIQHLSVDVSSLLMIFLKFCAHAAQSKYLQLQVCFSKILKAKSVTQAIFKSFQIGRKRIYPRLLICKYFDKLEVNKISRRLR